MELAVRDPLRADALPYPLEALSGALGHEFADKRLLAEALTHVSAAGGRAGEARGFERLEFLGDRVLGMLVAELLWRAVPDAPEGVLTDRFHYLVRREMLIEVAQEIGLGPHIRALGGEDIRTVRAGGAILADALEAVIAALYLDGGWAAAGRFVRTHWERRLAAAATAPTVRAAKSRLQEWALARALPLPLYELLGSEGPAHKPVFRVRVTIAGQAPAVAEGTSRRAAETAAATQLLATLTGGAP